MMHWIHDAPTGSALSRPSNPVLPALSCWFLNDGTISNAVKRNHIHSSIGKRTPTSSTEGSGMSDISEDNQGSVPMEIDPAYIALGNAKVWLNGKGTTCRLVCVVH